MPSYFDFYPQVLYQSDSAGRSVVLTNIARRFVVRKSVLGRQLLFDSWHVRDGERPDVVAAKYYQDSSLDWLVMMANEIVDPQFQWYMGYQDFKAFLIGKYGSVEEAHRTTHHYEQLMLESRFLNDGTETKELWLEIDSTTYHHTPEDHRKCVSCYTYEDLLNKKRQNIQLIHRSYASQIVREVETVIKT